MQDIEFEEINHTIEGQVLVYITHQPGEDEGPDGAPMLRMSAIDLRHRKGHPVDRAEGNSCCTAITVYAPRPEVEAFAKIVAERLAGEDHYWERIFEDLSWTTDDDLLQE